MVISAMALAVFVAAFVAVIEQTNARAARLALSNLQTELIAKKLAEWRKMPNGQMLFVVTATVLPQEPTE